MLDIKTYCPASLSFIFKVCPNKNLIKTGSVGIGCTIDKGVRVKAKPSTKTEIFFNHKKIHFPTVEYACRQITKKLLRIEIKSPLPLGFGFGLSSASTLASLSAVNKIFHLHKSRKEIIAIAHLAEIVNKTGLGSVTTQTTGGFLLKKSPGLDFDFVRLPFTRKKIYAVIIDKLETPKVLKNKKLLGKINIAADLTFKKLEKIKKLSLEKIIDISYEFVKESGLLKEKIIKDLIEKIRSQGGHATMAMLGKVVLSDRKPRVYSKYRVEKLKITDDIVKII